MQTQHSKVKWKWEYAVMFFNVVASSGLGEKNDILQEEKSFYGQAQVSINANPLNGNLFVKDFTKSFNTQGFIFDVGYRYNSQSSTPWQLNQGKVIRLIQGLPNTQDSIVTVKNAMEPYVRCVHKVIPPPTGSGFLIKSIFNTLD